MASLFEHACSCLIISSQHSCWLERLRRHHRSSLMTHFIVSFGAGNRFCGPMPPYEVLSCGQLQDSCIRGQGVSPTCPAPTPVIQHAANTSAPSKCLILTLGLLLLQAWKKLGSSKLLEWSDKACLPRNPQRRLQRRSCQKCKLEAKAPTLQA